MSNSETLPELLYPGLKVVFVGINPGTYSTSVGHYYARPSNPFWTAFTESLLSQEARRRLGRNTLTFRDDELLKEYGFGFTDIVKRSTTQSDDLTAADWIEAVPNFISRINAVEPRVVCIMALNDYRDYVCPIAYRIGGSRRTMRDRVKDGWQPESRPIGKSMVYVTYNPAGRPVGGVSRKDILVKSLNQIAAEIFPSRE